MRAAVHKHSMDIIYVEGQDMEKLTEHMQKNDEYRQLWQIFFDTIGIEARKNPKCQQNHMPKWYRKYMTETVSYTHLCNNDLLYFLFKDK